MARIVSNAEVFAYLGKSTPTSEESVLMNLLAPMAEGSVRQHIGYSVDQQSHTHFLPERDSLEGDVNKIDSVNDRVFFEYGHGTDKLYLPERAVRSITSVYEDQAAYNGQGTNDFAVATLLTAGTDYYLDYTAAGVSWSGMIRKIAGTWPSRSRTIKVTYVAGFTASELSGEAAVVGPNGVGVGQLKWATLLAVAIAYKQNSSLSGSNVGPVVSERLADYSVSYGNKSAENLFGFKQGLPEQVKDLLSPFRRYDI